MDTEPTSLSELVFIAMRRHETTAMTRLAEVAQKSGYRITHTMLSQVRLRRYNHRLKEPAVRALAFLSDVPVSKVNELAERGPVLGTFSRQMPDEIDILRGPARDAMVRLGRVLVDMEREIQRLQSESDESGTSDMPESELPFSIPEPNSDEDEGS